MSRTTIFNSKNHCPVCGKVLDAATHTTGNHTPKRDDLSICFYCLALLTYYDDEGNIRKLTQSDLDKIPDDVTVELFNTRAKIKQFREQKNE